ncbi:hypothetical protein [uncultured Sphingomonas sp.]|uniref:hypothetical protein n=1 Tax=uncultured Sphingomonas sp. TaxID=158754 RepID=UPI0035CBE8C1
MLLNLVERHMRAKRMSPSRFGIEALGDPQFVFQLRLGREPRSKTVQRVIAYVEADGGIGAGVVRSGDP